MNETRIPQLYAIKFHAEQIKVNLQVLNPVFHHDGNQKSQAKQFHTANKKKLQNAENV